MKQVIRTTIGTFYFEPTAPTQILTLQDGSIKEGHNPLSLEDLVRQGESSGGSLFEARLFVGENIGSKHVWNRNDIRAQAFLIRERHLDDQRLAGLLHSRETPGMTLYATQGVFSSDRDPVIENSVQITIFKGAERDFVFKRAMAALAQELADNLSQESVILNITRNNRPWFSLYVRGNPEAFARVSAIKKETAWFNEVRLGGKHA